MPIDLVSHLFAQLIWTAVLVCAPVMGVALVVGVVVSVLQAATQVQEMSLSFVPKLLAVAGTLALVGPWILRRIASFATAVISDIPGQF